MTLKSWMLRSLRRAVGTQQILNALHPNGANGTAHLLQPPVDPRVHELEAEVRALQTRLEELPAAEQRAAEAEQRANELERQATELGHWVRGLQADVAARDAKLSRLNLDMFRVETKDRVDERAAAHTRGDLEVEVIPHEQYPHTYFRVKQGGREFKEMLHYSHHALAELITKYDFQSVLDVGSAGGTSARVFEFLGKEVHTIEIQPTFGADNTRQHCGDYLDIRFPQTFDCIWLSHVLEHQRNIGRFLEKMYHDLTDGGVLAISVPSALSPFLIGHCNTFTPLHLIYHLILAGFDCRDAQARCYDWQVSVLVRKVPNGIPSISFATIHNNTLGDGELGVNPRLFDFFPVPVPPDGHVWGEVERINW